MRHSKTRRCLATWLSDYAESHQHPINKRIHNICVPAIFISILGMGMALSWWGISAAAILVAMFYFSLSLSLFFAMSVFMAASLTLLWLFPLGWAFWLAVFVVAWVGQFIGHKIEGKKPSFFEDLQFLLIGPAWVAYNLAGRSLDKHEVRSS